MPDMAYCLAALVPMRHPSERVPQKNFREFAGRPLFHYILDTLQACTPIDEIVVDTASPVIKDRLKGNYPSVRIIVDGLNLSAVKGGRYELLCMPIKLQGSDEAPARVALRAAQLALS
jgi:2-C-methyl-D-erythritol 4-phosphate cytidylyltransferase